MRIKTVFLISFIALQAAATPPSMCGRLDFDKVKNADLEQIFKSEDVINQRALTRVQCGLPGETLNICQSCATETTEESMQIIRPLLATDGHLDWHFNWHRLRIPSINYTAKEYQEAQSQKWVPESLSFEEFTQQHIIGGSLSGEDFLYMHRLMIKMLQSDLAANGQPCFMPWSDLPNLEDANWPYPKKLETPEAKSGAEKYLNTLRTQLAKLRNPTFLKKVTLNRLGQIIEMNLHPNLHGFYRGTPICSVEAKAQGYCDDLIPNETSPVNRHFWKFHGMIDNLIGDWLNANGFSEISRNCEGKSACYQWGDVWLSKYPGQK